MLYPIGKKCSYKDNVKVFLLHQVHEVLNKADDPLIPEADGNCLMQAVVNVRNIVRYMYDKTL